MPEKLLDGFLCYNPRKGTPVAIDAYVRTSADGKGIEAVIKHVELPNAKSFCAMIFEHYDTGKTYIIPDDKCNIDDFRVEGNVLVLSTGERVAFSSQKGAEKAWIWFNECFRDGRCSSMFIEEKTTAHGWYH